MSIFKIKIKAGDPAVYGPNPQIVYVNDSVFWFNGDPNEPHWPAPNTAKPKGFMAYQIPPNTQSNQVGFPTAQTISYICINHPGESGQIIVRTPKQSAFADHTKKSAYGDKTKKGAYGKTTKKA